MNELNCEQVIKIAGDDNRMRHALFARLVLGWDDLTCIHVREAFGHIPLSLATMREMARLDANLRNRGPRESEER